MLAVFFNLVSIAVEADSALYLMATLFPLGILQLYESVHHGYFEARTLKFLGNPVNSFIEWIRFPGDAVFILGGILYLALSTPDPAAATVAA